MQVYMARLEDKSNITVDYDKEKPIDDLDCPIKVQLCSLAYFTLSLKDAERLQEQLGFCIQDYKKEVLGA